MSIKRFSVSYVSDAQQMFDEWLNDKQGVAIQEWIYKKHNVALVRDVRKTALWEEPIPHEYKKSRRRLGKMPVGDDI